MAAARRTIRQAAQSRARTALASSIRTRITRAADRAESRTYELMDQIGRAAPALPDEALCWLVSYLHFVAVRRPHDPADAWSVLLRSMAPSSRVDTQSRLIVALAWTRDSRMLSVVDEFGSHQARITIRSSLRRATRRVVLAQELRALGVGDSPSKVAAAGTRATWLPGEFDVDVDQMVPGPDRAGGR